MRNSAQTAQWKELIRQSLCDLRVAIPGIVVSFDVVTQTAVVQPAVREKLIVPGKPAQNVAINPIYDVPVVMPRGGGYSMTLPLAAGDECLLVFNDMAIDNWWQNGGVQNQYQFESMRHDIADAVCIPGPWSQPRVLANYSPDSLQIRSDDGDTIIDVSESGVSLESGSTTVDVSSDSVSITASSSVQITSPEIRANASAGAPLALVNDNGWQWIVNDLYPWMQAQGYSGAAPPLNGETTVLKGQ
jgi:hypothetical protein